MTFSKKIFAGSTCVVLILLVFAFFYKKNHSGEWTPIRESKITEAIYGLATLESDDMFRYRVGVTSQIEKIFFKEGAKVKKGDLLIRLSEGVLVHSPLDGVVTQLDTKESETVFPNITLITVMNLQRVALSITLEQASAIRVRTQLPVKIQFETLKGTPLVGIVRSVYPKDGQFVVKVDLKDAPPSILPGMTADTAIIVGEKEKAMVVPVQCVQRGILTIRENGKIRKIKVKIGFQDSENVELLGSDEITLKPGIEVWKSKR